MTMDPQLKLHLALIQVENVMRIIKDNPYEHYMFMRLNTVKLELKRQLNQYPVAYYDDMTLDNPTTTKHGGDMDAL